MTKFSNLIGYAISSPDFNISGYQHCNTEDSTSHVYKTISKWTVGAIARAHVRQKTLGRTCLLFSKSLNYHNFCYSYD